MSKEDQFHFFVGILSGQSRFEGMTMEEVEAWLRSAIEKAEQQK